MTCKKFTDQLFQDCNRDGLVECKEVCKHTSCQDKSIIKRYINGKYIVNDILEEKAHLKGPFGDTAEMSSIRRKSC